MSKNNTPSQGDPWLDSLYRAPEQEQGEYQCAFSAWDKNGDSQDCWFKPSPETCQLCLLGQIAEHLGMLKVAIDEDQQARRKQKRPPRN